MASIRSMETTVHREVHMIQQSRPLLEWHIQNEYIKFQILLLNMKHWLKGYW